MWSTLGAACGMEGLASKHTHAIWFQRSTIARSAIVVRVASGSRESTGGLSGYGATGPDASAIVLRHPNWGRILATFDFAFTRSGRSRRVAEWLQALRGMLMAEHTAEEEDAFVWRRGRDVVRLKRDGDGWYVTYQTVGKLMGPQRCVYEARHRQAKHAAWDMMARVINASRDEQEGVEAASMAARWMRRVSAS